MINEDGKISIIAGSVLLLVVLMGVFALAWHKIITGGEAMTVVVTIIGIAGGILGHKSGVKAGMRAAKQAYIKEDV